MNINVLEYHQMLKEKNIHTIYSGPIWADGIEGIAGMLKRQLEYNEMPFSASQAVFSVFVEQMNNILMYSAEKEQFETRAEKNGVSKGTFILGSSGKMFFIQTGNVIKNASAELIKNRIDYLNSLDKKELRQYYKEQIKAENTNPESKGAGIGLIEVARRASSPIEYSFTPYGEEVSFFTMFVSIG